MIVTFFSPLLKRLCGRKKIFYFTAQKFFPNIGFRDLKKSIRWRALREPPAHSQKESAAAREAA